jgi:hypothetical protein
MLRLDPGPVFSPDSIPVPGEVYRIPADNPFVGDAGVRDEIWALGLRNPYRFSFDRETGDVWIADVGQGTSEEIDFEPADDPGGRNYGWDVMEGFGCNDTDPAPAPPCNDPSLTLPVHAYGHTDGNGSVTGGYVDRGPISPLSGLYFFGDFLSGNVWSLDPDTLSVTPRTAELGDAGGVPYALVGFGEDGFGALHLVLRDGGRIFRIVPADPACDDGVDNDGDGDADFPADAGCADAGSENEGPQCDDGLDNDGDGKIDTADPQCASASDDRERATSGCGLGLEAALVLLPLLALRRSRAPGARAV